MKSIRINIHICGMNYETFTDIIMIYKPRTSITFFIN